MNRSPMSRHRAQKASARGVCVQRMLAASLSATVAISLGCDAPSSARSSSRESTTVTSGAGHAATPHGDHAPHHGGAVLMHGDLHYEIVLPPGGGAQLYLSDEIRQDLPASVVSSVVIEVERPGAPAQTMELAADASGAFWRAEGPRVGGDGALVRVGFAYDGGTVSVELPYGTYFVRVGPSTAGERAR
jgi:hypothetical protein